MFIVSACLAGVKCKYNAEDNLHPQIRELLKQERVQLVCPEQLGGLSTPRCPAEIAGGSGEDVWSGKAQVLTREGTDVTGNFIRGGEETLRIARLLGAKGAILKEGSPSCGSSLIYDGTFQGVKKPGQGVTAALLRKEGLKVYSENDFAE
ncbi:MAG: DUF523 domain-containing protein [Clostridia bacterium]|nr:DUF523 domain-containing protein [Clostridia bacterium]